MVHVVGLEVMKYGHGHSAVGERGDGGDGPLCAVFAAEGYLVAGFYAGMLEKEVQFGNFAGDVAILKRRTFEVGKGKSFPVLAN